MKQLLCQLSLILVGLTLTGCTRPDPPAPSSKTVQPPVVASRQPDIQSMLIETPPSLPALTLSARVTYAEDGFSRISSPLQGPVLDVRVKLGQAVKAGDILMVIDAADIATAYAAYVEEISELGLAERNYELTKDLYDAQAGGRTQQAACATTNHVTVRTAQPVDGNRGRAQCDTGTNCRPCFGHAVVYRRQSRPFAGRRGCV